MRITDVGYDTPISQKNILALSLKKASTKNIFPRSAQCGFPCAIERFAPDQKPSRIVAPLPWHGCDSTLLNSHRSQESEVRSQKLGTKALCRLSLKISVSPV